MAGSGKKWGIIGGSIAGGVALFSFIPALKRRAMRVTTILTKDHRVVSGLITTLQMTPRINGMVRRRLLRKVIASQFGWTARSNGKRIWRWRETCAYLARR